MNEKTISDTIAKQFFLTKVESREIVRLLLSKAAESLKKNERVYFRGFGSFLKVKRSTKKVRHPKTGKIITLPERIAVSFRPSSTFLKKIV